jgi:hypothetical protein
MPERAEYGLTATDVRTLKWLVQRVRTLGLFEGGDGRPQFTVTRALASGAHAAGVTQSVNLCDSSWAAISGVTADAENPSGVEIPDGTRLVLVPGDTSMIILQAFICTE